VPAVVRRFEEHLLPELVVAAEARNPGVSHAAAAPGRLPGRLAGSPGGPVPSRLGLVNLAQSSGKPTLAIAFNAVATGFGGFAPPETARPVAREPCAAATRQP
jgi:hypothetical protein